jgi:hypothetical protein
MNKLILSLILLLVSTSSTASGFQLNVIEINANYPSRTDLVVDVSVDIISLPDLPVSSYCQAGNGTLNGLIVQNDGSVTGGYRFLRLIANEIRCQAGIITIQDYVRRNLLNRYLAVQGPLSVPRTETTTLKICSLQGPFGACGIDQASETVTITLPEHPTVCNWQGVSLDFLHAPILVQVPTGRTPSLTKLLGVTCTNKPVMKVSVLGGGRLSTNIPGVYVEVQIDGELGGKQYRYDIPDNVPITTTVVWETNTGGLGEYTAQGIIVMEFQ